MRYFLRVLFISIIIFSGSPVFSQLVFWSVNFNNGCASNCIANTYGGWTILNNDGGTSGGASNNWFVSCAEEGITPPGCGSSCIGDASLHIGNDPGSGGDMGASYNETGATNATYKTAVSPTISTVGRSTITLKFDFIAFGSSACSDDRAQLRLSTDNGATWPVGFQYCLTSVCCGACNGYSQGQWTTYTLALPAAFNNNPNVRIGFNWRNNGNGSGTDPSVAIDDIQMSVINPVPLTLLSFNAAKAANQVNLNWVTTSESQLSRYELERSTGSAGFVKLAQLPAKGNQNAGQNNYAYTDGPLFPVSVFYRLKMIDNDGKFKYSKVVHVGAGGGQDGEPMILSASSNESKLLLSLWSGYSLTGNLTVYDMQGKKVEDLGTVELKSGETQLSYPLKGLSASYYMVRFTSSKAMGKPVNLSGKFLFKK